METSNLDPGDLFPLNPTVGNSGGTDTMIGQEPRYAAAWRSGNYLGTCGSRSTMGCRRHIPPNAGRGDGHEIWYQTLSRPAVWSHGYMIGPPLLMVPLDDATMDSVLAMTTAG